MDNRNISPTVRHSSAEAEISLGDPFSRAIPSNATISYDTQRDNSIVETMNLKNSSPTMPSATQFIPTVTSTATHFATFISTDSENGNKVSNLNQPMIHENSIAVPDVFIKQEESIIDDRIVNDNRFEFIRPYEYDCRDERLSFSAQTNTTTINHRIHVNPSILLSKHRANYSGPGTPMPNLPNDYYYSHQSTNWTQPEMKVSEIVSRRKKRSRKSKYIDSSNKGQSELNEYFSSVHPRDFAKLILDAQARDNRGSKRKRECLTEKMENNPIFNACKSKKVDARLWLNAKAKLIAQAQTNIATSSSSSSTVTTQFPDFASELSYRRFIDRATSPINFPEDKQTIKSKTRDIALSPIRFIEPQLKHFRSHSDRETAMNLSLALSQTIESANKTKILNCLLDSQHSCGKCIVMSRQMVEPICPICHAKKGKKLTKST